METDIIRQIILSKELTMPNQTMAAWIVRCGERGQKGALERFEANAVAALGWETGDLSQIGPSGPNASPALPCSASLDCPEYNR